MTPGLPGQAQPEVAVDPEVLPHRLQFHALNQRIDALPEGPISVLCSPRWQQRLDRVATIPFALAALLSLSASVDLVEPGMAMATTAAGCLLLSVGLWLPGWVRALWVIGRDMRKGVAGFMQQWDHDLLAMEAVVAWLRGFPRAELQRKRQQCLALHEGLQQKLGLFSGGMERLGILPALVAMFYLLRERQQLMEMPGWLLLLGVAIVFVWFMAVQAARARMRLQLMASLLQEALHGPEAIGAPQAEG